MREVKAVVTNLKAEMMRAGLSDAEVARRIGRHGPQVSRLARVGLTDRCSYWIVTQLAEVLGVEPSVILEGEDGAR